MIDPNGNFEKPSAPVGLQPGINQVATYSKNPQTDTNAQMLLAIKTLTDKMEKQKEDMERKKLEEENKRLQEKMQDMQNERIRDQIRDLNVAMNRGGSTNNIVLGQTTSQQQQQEQQQQQNQEATKIVPISTLPIYIDGRLEYDCGMYCLILVLNIFLPGVGSILAGILYGNTSKAGDRTGNIICHGIGQLIFAITIFGWVWAVRDALNRFAYGSCSACACFD